ncbi:type II toxin-antitoxin system death-on-curing family toxin [Rhodococcus sp. D2-41]|uniref:Fic family protein n=1 Tax=Speluncibacter jeojiensis TaxID=2710754 RepID=A0A9X4M1M0_9ACTN|nr:Fic family protein [Rhodococcus sp. D2-41]MDG3011496.1 type II toxin-antitoxin system death-on-curing family toxin [Rhodococcus sp. D2-41]MDG3015149.1 Fic family protein [Corynebacteriales bacterium D3-21]
MTAYLDRDDLLTIAARINNGNPAVREMGLLDAAIARPRSTVFGVDAYPTLFEKSAALLHSVARNYALIDGNKRTAWAAAWLFLGYNGMRLRRGFDVDGAEQLMNEVAAGVHDVDGVAAALGSFAE